MNAHRLSRRAALALAASLTASAAFADDPNTSTRYVGVGVHGRGLG